MLRFPDYRSSSNEYNFSCKIVKYRIPSEVCKNTASQYCFYVMYKKYKLLAYTSLDLLLARFCKVNLSSTKNSAGLFILASLLDKGMRPINYKLDV